MSQMMKISAHLVTSGSTSVAVVAGHARTLTFYQLTLRVTVVETKVDFAPVAVMIVY